MSTSSLYEGNHLLIASMEKPTLQEQWDYIVQPVHTLDNTRRNALLWTATTGNRCQYAGNNPVLTTAKIRLILLTIEDYRLENPPILPFSQPEYN